MNLQQLEYLVALEEHCYFIKAAEFCGVTQPTLSMMVQKMEDELGVKIYIRGKQPITFTTIGKKIVEQAKVTLYEMRKIKELASVETDTIEGEIRLGIIPTVAPYLVPQLIAYFREKFPQIYLNIKELTTDSIIHQLTLLNIDMAILATPLLQDEFLEIPLYYEKFVAYFSQTYPHLKQLKPTIKVTDLPIEHVWVLQEGHCLRNQVFNFCNNQLSQNQEYEAGSIDTLIKIVDSNGGYTVIPELHIHFLEEKQKESLREFDAPPAVREISLIFKQHYMREGIINLLVNAVKAIIPAHMIDDRLKKFRVRL